MQGLGIPVPEQTLFINVPPLKTIRNGDLSIFKISGTFYSNNKPQIRYQEIENDNENLLTLVNASITSLDNNSFEIELAVIATAAG